MDAAINPAPTLHQRLAALGVPGFRSATRWKAIVAVLGYVLILLLALATLQSPAWTVVYLVSSLGVVALATNFRGLRKRTGRHALWLGPIVGLVGMAAFGAGLPTSPEARAAAQAKTAEREAQKQAQAASQVADQKAKVDATAAAQAGRDALTAQARAEAVDFLGAAVARRQAGELGIAIELARQAQGKWADYPDARSFLAEVQPQATAAAQAANAQATAAAVAQAQANAQATAQAAAAATAAAAQPIVLSGRGQTATNSVTPRSAQNVATFTHNGRSNFAVYVFRGGARDLLINKIGAYQGQRPILGAEPFTLQIEADGAWTVSVAPVVGNGAAPFKGSGDAVSLPFTPPANGAWEFANEGRSNFAVYLHCRNGRNLIQNRIGVFSGSAVMQFGTAPCFWEVQSDGAWSMTPR